MAGAIFGSSANTRPAAPEVAGFKVQTSVYGLPIPIVYGQARVAGNLIHMYPSTATPQVSQGSRTKFSNKVDKTVTGYLYTAPIVLGLSEGPILGIGKVWRDKDAPVQWSIYQLFGWSLFLGSLTQSPWTFLSSNHPSDAVPYQLTAYVAHSALELPNDVLSNYTWEVRGLLQYGGGIVDANPKDILVDVTTDANHGAGFPSAQLGDLTGYSNYCIAAGLFLSPALNAQGPLLDGLQQMFDATASAPVWSDGKLKVIPYADQAITGHSVTFTPNVTPIYDLTDNDFLDKERPVKLVRKKASDCFNQVLVRYEDRAHDYNPNVQEAKDQASIEATSLRPAPALQLTAIKDAATARYIAQLRLQRELNVRNTYSFRLPVRYALLEPMDLVTLTDPGLGLNLTPVRITIVEEEENGDLAITAEEFPAGVASASRYGAPGAGGTRPANNAPPGATSAVAIFEGPGPLLQSTMEIWLAASGGADWGGCDVYFSTDNVSFAKVGSILKKGSFGTLTAALATAVASPPNDTTHTLAVDLGSSGGTLAGGSASDLAAIVTLSIVENEFLAFQTAVLTGGNQYNLTTLARGLFHSPIPSSHAIGSAFVRCDDAVLKVPYPQGVDGQIVYFKFPAFNAYGLGLEDVSTVGSFSHTIGRNEVTSSLPPTLIVTATPGGTPTANYSVAWSATGIVTLSIDGGSYVTPSSSPISVARHATLDHVYAFKCVTDTQTISDSVTIPSLANDHITPDVSVTPGTPTSTQQPFTVNAKNPVTGAVINSIVVTPFNCTMVIGGTTYSTAQTVADGTVVTANRPTTTTDTQAHLTVRCATFAGGPAETIDVEVIAQLNVGPLLEVKTTPGATGTADYSITWTATGTVTLSIDGGSYGTPSASPITVARHAILDHVYIFKCVRDGQTFTDQVTIPSLRNDHITPDLSVTPGTPTSTQQPFTVSATNPVTAAAINSIVVTPYNCTMVIGGTTYSTAQTVASGTVVTANRPTTTTATQAHINIRCATFGGGPAETIDVEIIAQLNFGPTLTVTATPGTTASDDYSIYWSGTGTITYCRDNLTFITPASNPLVVSLNDLPHTYTFKAVADGQTITNDVHVPALPGADTPFGVSNVRVSSQYSPCDGGGSVVVQWDDSGLPVGGSWRINIDILSGTYNGTYSYGGGNSGDTFSAAFCPGESARVTVLYLWAPGGGGTAHFIAQESLDFTS